MIGVMMMGYNYTVLTCGTTLLLNTLMGTSGNLTSERAE